MIHLPFATIKMLRKALKDKKISAQELLQFYHERCIQYDKDLGSLLEIFHQKYDTDEINEDNAMQQHSLQGIPGVIKDNICIKGKTVSCASKMLNNYKAPYDATVIDRLRKVGASFLGRSNMDEFAMGSSTETSAFFKTKNPWNNNRVPGGSSGGSAAAVAGGLAPWALGSDTGGSVRFPAALCGIVGFKPTYGLVPRYGLIAYGSSLDQIGIMTRSVYDTAYILSVIAGQDSKDSSTRAVAQKDYTQCLDAPLKTGLKIGVIDNLLYADGMDPEIAASVEEALKKLESLGATIQHVQLPSLDYSVAAYFIVSRAEAASNLARFDGVRYGMRVKTDSINALYSETRHDGFGEEVRKRILVGNYVLSAGHAGQYYENAKKVIQAICYEFNDVFREVDLLVMPTHPIPAFAFGAFDVNKLQMDLQDYFTCPVNLAGLPAISLPCGLTREKLPIGFQLIGNHLSEDLILRVAHAYEQKTEWHMLHPTGF